MFRKKFFRSFFDDESDSSVVRTKFIQNRIKMVEKHSPALVKAFVDYRDKIAKSQDCVDHIAEVLEQLAKAENVTTVFKHQISDFANVLLDVGSKQGIHVQTMETKVLAQLRKQEKLCGDVQSGLKLSAIIGLREMNWARYLQRLRGSQFQNPEEVSLAEEEFLRAKAETARSYEYLHEQLDIFERKRLNVMKETLLVWSLAELHYHSKALELFTDMYRIAADIDVNADMEEFRYKFISMINTPRSACSQRSESVPRPHRFRRDSESFDRGISSSFY